MKKIALSVLFAVLASTQVFAAGTGDIGSVTTQSTDISQAALALLLKTNPMIRLNMQGGEKKSVLASELLAGRLITQFDKHGIGTLSTLEIRCDVRQRSTLQDCVVHISEDSMERTEDGGYANYSDSEEGAMESDLFIQFTVQNRGAMRIVGQPTYNVAE